MRQDIGKDLIWNTVGSTLYALMAAVLSLAALRLAGPDDGGIFGFGFSTLGQQLFVVAYFGIRPFHISDTSRRYSYREYRDFRRLSALAALVLGAMFLFIMSAAGSYTPRKCAILALLIAIKVTDAVADLYESECQRIGRLYIAGMELSLRSAIVSAVFIAMLMAGGNLPAAALAALIIEILIVLSFKFLLENRLLVEAGIEEEASSSLGSLLGETFLIFLSVFLDFLIFSAARYAVDLCMTDADNGIFNILFMPTSLIYLAANFVIRPYISRLSALLDEGDTAVFLGELRRLTYMVIALGLTAFILSLFLGRYALRIGELILGAGYTGVLSSQSLTFALIILGGACYALCALIYYILVILRCQRAIFTSYLFALPPALLISFIAVKSQGITGAGIAYAVYMLIMTLIFGCRLTGALGERL